jgi:3-methyl-2-oxobutanoate hydroxymethyltransferase
VIRADALALQDAGASMLVLECVPAALAAALAAELDIPVIGIGAGNGCDGQVLVLHDMLGLTAGPAPRFSKDFMPGGAQHRGRHGRYVERSSPALSRPGADAVAEAPRSESSA